MVGGTVVLLFITLVLGIVVPLHLRVEVSRVSDNTPPTTLQGNVQVQGDSHLLVHIQEGFAASNNHSGGT